MGESRSHGRPRLTARLYEENVEEAREVWKVRDVCHFLFFAFHCLGVPGVKIFINGEVKTTVFYLGPLSPQFSLKIKLLYSYSL